MSFLHRYHVAFLPLAVLPIPFAVEYLSRRSRWSGVLAILALLGWSLQSWPSVKERLAAEEYSRQVQQCVVGQLSTLPGRPTVAIVDAGRIPYWCDLPTIDVWGLCDREIARRGFSAKAIMEKSPEVYVTSVDVIAPGVEKARLGMDQLMMNEPQFIGRYLLWQSCLGGTTTKFWRYDYAILLNAAWAKRQGIELRPVQ